MSKAWTSLISQLTRHLEYSGIVAGPYAKFWIHLQTVHDIGRFDQTWQDCWTQEWLSEGGALRLLGTGCSVSSYMVNKLV